MAENNGPKYRLTDEKIEVNGVTLYRIQALRDFGQGAALVKKGELGGFIQGEDKLSQLGNAWVGGDARVSGAAWIVGDARVEGNAWVSGNAEVWGNARVSGNAKVFGKAEISGNAWVDGNAQVFDYARVFGDAHVYEHARVFGNASVSGHVQVRGYTRVSGNTRLDDNTQILSDAAMNVVGSRTNRGESEKAAVSTSTATTPEARDPFADFQSRVIETSGRESGGAKDRTPDR